MAPMSFKNDQKQASTSALDQAGASWSMGMGDWVVNVPVSSGSGLTLQGGASSGTSWLLLAAAAGAAFLLLRKRGK